MVNRYSFPKKNIRGIYVSEGYANSGITPELLEKWESNGLTDVWYMHNVGNTGSSNLLNLQNMINALENTNLSLHVDTPPFMEGSNYVDPSDLGHLSLINSEITALLEEYSTIQGISFDDFQYPGSIYNANITAGTPTINQMTTNLVNFIESVQTTIKDINSSLSLSASVGQQYVGHTNAIHENGIVRAANMASIAPYVDYMMAEVYPDSVIGEWSSGDTYNPYSSQLPFSWIKEMCEYTVNQVGNNCEVLIDLITFQQPSTSIYRTDYNLMNDIHSVLRSDVSGYVLLSYPHCSSTIQNGTFNFLDRFKKPEITRQKVTRQIKS